MTYDAVSRQTSDAQLYGTISRQFDLAGRLTRVTWWDGFYVDYVRDVTGQLLQVRENGATSGAGVLATFGYDDLGRRTSKTFGYGAATYYTYDSISRLNSLGIDFTGTANDLSLNFAHNPASQIVTTTRSNDAYAWTGHGNGSTATVVNGLNQLHTVGSNIATYDANGNLTADPITGQTFAYTSENQLRGNSSLTLAYDALGRAADHSVGGSVTAQFLFDGVQVAGVFTPGSGLTERYVWGDGPDELIAWYDGSGTAGRRYAQTDERGSLLAYSDSSGTVMGINKYDEYGRPQSSNTGRFQYTGQMWLPQIAFHFYKARVYDPRSGKFLQADPIGYKTGPNLYAYVFNDPVNLVDPLGLLCVAQGAATCPVIDSGSDPWIIIVGSFNRLGAAGTSGGGGSIFGGLFAKSKSPDGGGGRGGRALLVGILRSLLPTSPCPSRVVTVSAGPSVTGFLLDRGASVGVNVTFGIPADILQTGSLRGFQVGISVNGTWLSGAGIYGAVGARAAVGSSPRIQAGLAATNTLQAGAAWGSGAEITRTSDSVSVAYVKGAGGYAAAGQQISATVTTKPIGCYE